MKKHALNAARPCVGVWLILVHCLFVLFFVYFVRSLCSLEPYSEEHLKELEQHIYTVDKIDFE